ncbi:MAG: hypothetical protein HFJ45_00285 [Clostridia bacterium]|nr:hypothetical protein [Clostridia bacterium]
MNQLEQIKLENQNLIDKLKELAEIDEEKASVMSAIFIKTNDELRINNIKEIQTNMANKAKAFGVSPEKYIVRQESIIYSYIEQINKFMKSYNDEYINIKNKLQKAQENQKKLIFNTKKLSNGKKICILTNRVNEQILNEYDNRIKKCKEQINSYEDIISRCEEEFEACRMRRENDFKELFSNNDIGNNKGLTIIKNNNIFKRIKNIFNGYKEFSKHVLREYASRINDMKIETLEKHLTKIKKNMVDFSNEIDKMFENI